MSGIAGLYEPAAPRADQVLGRMLRCLAHRGPDGEGTAAVRARRGAPAVLLGHRRLDTGAGSAGAQPLKSAAAPAWIVFDGALYNRAELRERLKAPRGEGDAALALRAYLEWGLEGALARLRGMYAFAVADAREGAVRVFLARDRFGVKPVYYARGDWGFVFASELRALRAGRRFVQDGDAWLAFLMFGYVPEPMTTLAGAAALPAGHWVELSAATAPRPYHDLLEAYLRPRLRENAHTLARRLRDKLAESVARRLEGGGRIGAFLSGGIDSSALVALAPRGASALTTVSWEYEEAELSEEPYQRIVAARYKTDHRVFRLPVAEFAERAPEAVAAMDLPTIDGLNVYFVARAARDAGLKAALSGLGTTELFYSDVSYGRVEALEKLQRRSPAQRAAFLRGGAGRELARRCAPEYLDSPGAVPLYLASRAQASPSDLARLIGVPAAAASRVIERLEDDAVRRARAALDPLALHAYMESRFYFRSQILKDSDVMGLRHGVEIRTPFLDEELVEWLAAVPTALKTGKPESKFLLKKAMEGVLSRSIVYRGKQDFVIPHHRALGAMGASLYHDSLGILGVGAGERERLWRTFMEGGVTWYKVWTLMLAGWKMGLDSKRDREGSWR